MYEFKFLRCINWEKINFNNICTEDRNFLLFFFLLLSFSRIKVISFMKKFMILLIKGDDYTVEKVGSEFRWWIKWNLTLQLATPKTNVPARSFFSFSSINFDKMHLHFSSEKGKKFSWRIQYLCFSINFFFC